MFFRDHQREARGVDIKVEAEKEVPKVREDKAR